MSRTLISNNIHQEQLTNAKEDDPSILYVQVDNYLNVNIELKSNRT